MAERQGTWPAISRFRPKRQRQINLGSGRGPVTPATLCAACNFAAMRARQLSVAASITVLLAGCGGTNRASLATDAASFRRHLHHGQLLGRLDIPRLGASALVSA